MEDRFYTEPKRERSSNGTSTWKNEISDLFLFKTKPFVGYGFSNSYFHNGFKTNHMKRCVSNRYRSYLSHGTIQSDRVIISSPSFTCMKFFFPKLGPMGPLLPASGLYFLHTAASFFSNHLLFSDQLYIAP